MGDYTAKIRAGLANGTFFNSDAADLDALLPMAEVLNQQGLVFPTDGLLILKDHLANVKNNLAGRVSAISFLMAQSGEVYFDPTPHLGSVMGETTRLILLARDAIINTDSQAFATVNVQAAAMVTTENANFFQTVEAMEREVLALELNGLINDPIGAAVLSAAGGEVAMEVLAERADEIERFNGHDLEIINDGSVYADEDDDPDDCPCC